MRRPASVASNTATRSRLLVHVAINFATSSPGTAVIGVFLSSLFT